MSLFGNRTKGMDAIFPLVFYYFSEKHQKYEYFRDNFWESKGLISVLLIKQKEIVDFQIISTISIKRLGPFSWLILRSLFFGGELGTEYV